MLPEGGELNEHERNILINRIHRVVTWAKNVREMYRDEDARALWHEIYPTLSDGHAGLFGAVTSRSEAQVMRLACIYALLDSSSVVARIHLEAALSVWRYCEASARYIFGDAAGNRLADDIMAALRAVGSDGLTQTEINNMFSGHKKSGSITRALNMLYEQGRVSHQQTKTGGRPTTTWFAVSSGAEKAEKAEKP